MTSQAPLTVRLLGRNDLAALEAAANLFDNPLIAEEASAFLDSERDFIWIAYVEEAPAGFASATMVPHPDSRSVLFVNEVGVDGAFRRHGIGTALMRTAVAFCEARQWQSAWVLAEDDDNRAKSFYRSLDPATVMRSVMFEWEKV